MALDLLTSTVLPTDVDMRCTACACPLEVGMRSFEDETKATKSCSRCGGRAFYWRSALVPGDPDAPQGGRRSQSHYQPAWTCLYCGYLEPDERRGQAAGTEEAGAHWRM